MGKRRRKSEASDESEGEKETIKRPRGSPDWRFPLELCYKIDVCHNLLNFLRKCKDSSHRVLCENLVRVPSRRVMPQYYDVVSQPIDLIKIQQRLRTDGYQTVQAFLSDVKLLLDNVRCFYEPSSQDFKDATFLEEMFLEKVKELIGHMRDISGEIRPPVGLTLKIPKERVSSLHAPSDQSGARGSQSGAKPAVRMKLTRSKAWLREYNSSDDPVKMLLAAVYDCHDLSGEFVAEPFHELPSAKDYPEYYEIITEPLDLNTVQRSIEGGKYHNLRDVQDDLLLIVKNAHYFNEPISHVFKMATALRKFVLIKCSELERKYQTVSRTQSLKVSLKRPSIMYKEATVSCSSEGTGDLRKLSSAKHSIEDSDLDVDDSSDSSEDDAFDRSDEMECEEKRTLMLRIKKERDGREGDPVVRILKQKKRPVLKKLLLAVYHCIIMKTDAGRAISEAFMRKPSVKSYPEYYMVIKRPIDLREIRQKIRSKKYFSLDDLVVDVELLSSNACTFNENDSQVYKDALVLKELTHLCVSRLKVAWPCVGTTVASKPPISRVSVSEQSTSDKALGSSLVIQAKEDVIKRVESVCKPPTVPSAIKELLDAVIACRTIEGQYPWIFFKELPNPKLEPKYYAAVKKPIDTQIIHKKALAYMYSSVHDVFEDLHLLCDNVFRYYQKESPKYKSALVLYRITASKYLQLTAEERKENVMPNVQQKVKDLLREIFDQTMTHKDGSGRRLSEVFQDVIVSDEVRTHAESDPVVRSITLPLIEKWIVEGKYTRLDLLQSDLFALFSHGRLHCQVNPQAHSDFISLQRHYLLVRDQVCYSGKLLMSRALEYGLTELNEELEKITFHKEVVPQRRDETSMMEASRECEDNKSADHDARFNVSLMEIEYEGIIYHLGDTVYIKSQQEKKKNVVLLEKIWKDSSGSTWLEGCWFFWPEDTFHLATRKFYEKELFKSDFHGIARTSQLQGKCCVLYVKDYTRSMPKEYAASDVYVCESRYSHKAKSFKKIKNWKIHSSDLVVREQPVVLNKVPSVFAGSHTAENITDRDYHGEFRDDKDSLGDMYDDSSVDVVDEVPPLVQLQNVPANLSSHSEKGCCYYEQYCMDDDMFRIGDFVYVRSDQKTPFVSRIERIWTDSNGDPWFCGPWFVRPTEVECIASRMFYEQELFLSNISDTNPMRSIIGRCVVMTLEEIKERRPTDMAEKDVFVVESSYNESTKEIKKFKPDKESQLSSSVLSNEVFFFSTKFLPMKVPCIKYTASVPLLSTSTQSSSKQPSLVAAQLVVEGIAPVSSVTSTTTTVSPTCVVPRQEGTIHVISKLPTPILPTRQQMSTNYSGLVCRWEGCGKVFVSYAELASHMLFVGSGTHISREVDGSYYCRWYPCPRNPLLGGRPFNTTTKVTRHIKEVHLMKLSQIALSRRPQTEDSSSLSQPTTSTPSPPTSVVQYLTHSSTSTSMVSLPSVTPTSYTTHKQEDLINCVFHRPPIQSKQLLHSRIYHRYIEEMQLHNVHKSTDRDLPSVQSTVLEWFPPDALTRSGGSEIEMLCSLKEHMSNDAIRDPEAHETS